MVDGDYQFCFDNTFSTFNRKTVFFELLMENDENRDKMGFEGLEGLSPEEFYDMKAEEILDYIGKIRMHLQQARQIQDILKSQEARDRNTAEENFFKVNAWSMFQIITMILTGFLQFGLLNIHKYPLRWGHVERMGEREISTKLELIQKPRSMNKLLLAGIW
uniref:GOLD domain-containing protein n=1 Tax=Megaselia scalaris TaxID=36166 RepID=T1GT26_MEGSC